MKRFFTGFLCLLLVVSLTACGADPTNMSVEYDGVKYTLNLEEQTISDERGTYRYEFTGNMDAYESSIIYPDGTQYRETLSGNVSESSGEVAQGYTPGALLTRVLVHVAEKSGAPKHMLLSMLLAVLAMLHLFVPEWAWYFCYGWHYQNAEPSKLLLVMFRMIGVTLLLVAVAILVL